MKRLDRKPPRILENTPHVGTKQKKKNTMYNNNDAHTDSAAANKMYSTLSANVEYVCYLSAVTSSIHLQFRCVVTLYTTACKSIKQSCCADFYVWALKYSGSLYLMLAIFLQSGSFTHLSSK